LLDVHPLTVAKTRERWVKAKRLTDAPKAGRHKKLDGKQEAFLVALACSDAPDGQAVWTMQLLADKLVSLAVVETPVSDELVRRTLKKTNSSRGSRRNTAFHK
jgi:transposase